MTFICFAVFLALSFTETILLGGVGATALVLFVVVLTGQRSAESGDKRKNSDATSLGAVDSGGSSNDEACDSGGSEGGADGGGDGGGGGGD